MTNKNIIIGLTEGMAFEKAKRIDTKSFPFLEKLTLEEYKKFLQIFSNYKEEFKRMIEPKLKEITEGKGAYSQDRLTHAGNTIRDMKQLANDILKAIEEL